jgi:hypothetical protein
MLITVAPLDASAESLRDAQIVGPFGLLWNIQAYHTDTLRPVWSTTLEAGLFMFKPCGGLVCATSGGRVHGIDPATGAVRWRLPWSYAARAADSARPTIDAARSSSASAVAVADATSGNPRVGVIDLRTGTTLVNLGHWSPVGAIDAAWTPLIRPKPGSSKRTEVAALDRDGLKLHTLGEFSGAAAGSCQASEDHVACATTTGDVALWRYRPEQG